MNIIKLTKIPNSIETIKKWHSTRFKKAKKGRRKKGI